MNQRFSTALLAASLLAGLPSSSFAQGKASVTDAQVEANVLRALASAPELATQNIQSTSVYGTVTLSGNVHDEALRTRAENLVARADGVKKVIDEMTLGDTPPPSASDEPGAPSPASPEAQGALQSDGSVAPSPAGNDGTLTAASPEGAEQAAVPSAQQPAAAPAPPAGSLPGPPATADQAYGGYPAPPEPPPAAGYGNASNSAGNGANGAPYGNGYPEGNNAPAQQRAYGAPGYGTPRAYAPNNYPPDTRGDGQRAGIAVTVTSGASLQVRLDRGIDSNHIQPGTPFTGTLLNDVDAGGFVALPRGAAVQGTVVDAQRAGTFKGGGELALQLTSLSLGGRSFPMSTLVWERAGHDKTLSTVNTTLGLGALGAVFGGLAGGGAGAAIGAGVGGALGVGASVASPGGRVIVPPESVLTFSLASPLAVTTVSQGEMQGLAYAAGANPGQRPAVVRRGVYGGFAPYPPFGGYGPYPLYGGYGFPRPYPYGGYYWR